MSGCVGLWVCLLPLSWRNVGHLGRRRWPSVSPSAGQWFHRCIAIIRTTNFIRKTIDRSINQLFYMESEDLCLSRDWMQSVRQRQMCETSWLGVRKDPPSTLTLTEEWQQELYLPMRRFSTGRWILLSHRTCVSYLWDFFRHAHWTHNFM